MSLQRTYELLDVDTGLVQQLHDVLRFSDEGLVRVLRADAECLTVEVLDEGALRYLDALVEDVRTSARKLRSKIAWQRRGRRNDHGGNVDAELIARGDLYEIGPGLVGVRGGALEVFRFFERTFLMLAREYGALEEHHPVMVPIEVLEEVGYFAHFPHHVTFCSHFPEDLHLLEAVGSTAATNGGRLAGEHRAAAGRPSHVLTPAVCLPCYRLRRGHTVRCTGERAVTVQNHVFRYEGRNCRSLARCWDFTVRDLVLFGDGEEMWRLREAVMQWASRLCERLELDGRVELAHDPFFLSENREKRIYQRMGEVKYELLLSLPQTDEMLAVSSFNLHRSFYAEAYDIRLPDGRLAESACMGFGLERWTYAFLSQHGVDPGYWPSAVAREIGACAS